MPYSFQYNMVRRPLSIPRPLGAYEDASFSREPPRCARLTHILTHMMVPQYPGIESRDSSFYTPMQQPVLMPPIPTPLMERPLSGITLPRELRPLSSGDWGYRSSLHVRTSRYGKHKWPRKYPTPPSSSSSWQTMSYLPPIAATR